jgi:hypothetical protein
MALLLQRSDGVATLHNDGAATLVELVAALLQLITALCSLQCCGVLLQLAMFL